MYGSAVNVVASITRQTVPLPGGDILIDSGFSIEAITATDVVFAAAALVGGFVLSRITKRALIRFFRGLDGVPLDTGVMIARIVGYVILLIGLMVGLEALGFSWGPLGGLLILALIVLVFTAKPMLEDLGAGLVLQVRHPFGNGDLVDVDDECGVVVDVNSRTVILQTIDGRSVHVPSRRVLNSAIHNMSIEGSRLTTFVAGVEYSTDLDRARTIAVDAMSSAAGVHSEPPPEALVEEFSNSTINISCRLWHGSDQLSEYRARDEAMRAVKRAFDANGVVIAFPQRVLWRAGDGD